MENEKYSIGVYDSGIGGLTVWQQLRRSLQEDILYYGDTLHLPYGEKTRAQIVMYSRNIIRFFLREKVKAIVAACNTSSAFALPLLRGEYNVPLFDVIRPAAAQAAESTRNGRVGILATQATVSSAAYERELAKLDAGIQVFTQACPLLVPLIEAGRLDGVRVRTALKGYMQPLFEKEVDVVVMGCTHYPLLMHPLLDTIGLRSLQIIDPAERVAEDVRRWLAQHKQLSLNGGIGANHFWVSHDPDGFRHGSQQFLGDPLDDVRLFDAGADFEKEAMTL